MSNVLSSPRPPGARPLVIAHRGGAALMPENTLGAFDRAAALGVDAFELDVRLARDAVVVVHHDATVDRTTDGHGPVASFTAGELERLDAGRHFKPDAGSPERGRGHGVPRLRSVLERHPAMPVVVELKGKDPRLADAAVAEVRALGALQRVCFGAFWPRMIAAARALGADVITSATRNEIRWAVYGCRLGLKPWRPRYHAIQVPEVAGRTRIVSSRFVAAAHRAGVPVHVWTVDDELDMRRLIGMLVDGLITDRPDVAVSLVGKTSAPLVSSRAAPDPSRTPVGAAPGDGPAAGLGRRDSRG